MRVGVSSFWFNRGQAVVGRQLRSGLETLGHETAVLARPAKDTAAKPGALSRDDVWDQPGVTAAANYLITAEEMESWARENELEAVLFDQNYQFEEIGRLRALGVRTYGRFVWEQFSPEHVEGAKRAFDAVYSMTAAEQERYAGLRDREPAGALGLPPGAPRRRSRAHRARAGRHGLVLLPRRLHDQAKAGGAGPGGVLARSRRRTCAWWSRRRSSAA